MVVTRISTGIGVKDDSVVQLWWLVPMVVYKHRYLIWHEIFTRHKFSQDISFHNQMPTPEKLFLQKLKTSQGSFRIWKEIRILWFARQKYMTVYQASFLHFTAYSKFINSIKIFAHALSTLFTWSPFGLIFCEVQGWSRITRKRWTKLYDCKECDKRHHLWQYIHKHLAKSGSWIK